MTQRFSHRARFLKYRDESLILRCKEYAKWTLPQLMVDPSMHQFSRAVVERDYQEIGPLLVNNLAAKLTALLFPVSRPFYEVAPSPHLIARAKERGVSEKQLSRDFMRVAQKACKRLFRNASYAQLVQAVRHLIVTGNVLVFRDTAAQRFAAYGLQSWVCRRDGTGTVLDIVLREYTFIEALAPEIQKALRIAHPSKYRRTDDAPAIEIYTRIQRVRGKHNRVLYVVTQEADDVPVGEPGEYPEHLCPWFVVTWNLVAGEHYGRGHVEDYSGGFAKLSDGSEAAALYMIEILKIVNLVQPGVGADIDELAGAESGEWVQGASGAVTAHEAGHSNKVIAVRAELDAVFQNLARAFMWKANTRDAERVTAFELRQDAMEADNVLGGTYSALSEAFQVPVAHLLTLEETPNTLAGIADSTIKLDIIAGVPALGRNLDLQNLLSAAQDAVTVVPALAQLSQRISPDKLLELVLTLSNVDVSDFEKSAEELQQEQEAATLQQQGEQELINAEAAAQSAEALTKIA